MSSSLGWFGDPWSSYVCYDEDGGLREDAHVPFPDAGRKCSYCTEVFQPGDSGELVLASRMLAFVREYVHKECQLRMVLGSVADIDGQPAVALSKRRDALATWAWVMVHGTDAALAAAS